jgi:hypothetical protein|tara:strand:- start:161 stop:709 length:549 start_codon:yes stop_codon:yes gene_type:complete
MYSRPRRNWGVIALISILGLSNLSLVNTLVSHKFKRPYPNLNLPVGPYTSYKVVTSEKGYSISYKANDPKILARTKLVDEGKGLFKKDSKLSLRETYTMNSGSSSQPSEGSVMTDKDIACIKVEGSGNATGRVVGASVGVKAAPMVSSIPIVGWLAAGLVTMFAQDKASEIGGDIAKNYNDC